MSTASHVVRWLPRAVPMVAATLFLAGCTSVTPIRRLLDNPGRYDGKTVRVEGQVRDAIGGFGVGAYQVRDATGTLSVVSDKGSPPPTGATVTVKGIFQALFTLGNTGLAVLREQSRSAP